MDYQDDEVFNNDEESDHSFIESSIGFFSELSMKPEIIKAIEGVIENPTEVQSKCLLDAMEGKDILCQAKASSGKATMSVLAVLQQLNVRQPGVYALVICPSRNLLTKFLDCYKVLGKYMPLVKVDAFGQKAGNLTVTTGIHIRLGTPGRVIRAIRNRNLDYANVNHLVLYEADKMLSMLDMRSDIEEIYRKLPKKKQVLMFSEKFSKDVRPICKGFLHQPKVFIDDEANYINGNLDQFYMKIGDAGKHNKLIEILRILHFSLIIVYVGSPALCETITNLLKQAKLSTASYHLGMKVADRRTSINQFTSLKRRILVVAKQLEADVNIDELNVVIMYDKPTDVDMHLKYVTPASRSKDTNGLTITFLPEDDDLKMIQELEDWYSATFTEIPSKIQMEVTSYSCDS